MLIHITGASGSGTSTLAAALAQKHAFAHIEADDHYWLPTDRPFSSKRDPGERASMLVSALRAQANTVLAGSVVGWGAEIEDAFDLIVFLYLDADVRVERLRRRENVRFGYADPKFLEWAGQYDAGPPEGRSLAKHRAWLNARRCPVLELSGDLSVQVRLACMLRHMNELQQ